MHQNLEQQRSYHLRLKKIIFCMVILTLMLTAVTMSVKVKAASGDFTIADGVLVKYKGNSTKVIIPNSVTSIGISAFNGCKKIRSIIIPDSVTSIGDKAFFRCGSLASITIPDTVISIGAIAFGGCSSLTRITIPDTVISIGERAFIGCSKIKSIKIPNSLTRIGAAVFDGCSKLTSITIPNSVTSIGEGAFSGCSSLKGITIPNSIVSIEKSAFSGCSSLKNIIIPTSAIRIGSNVFDNTPWLEARRKESPFVIVNHILIDAITCNGKITIPKGVTEIGESAFYRASVKEVIIPEGVTKIGVSAFSSSELANVTIPRGVIEIGNDAFSRTMLKGIVIPDSVTLLGDKAFYRCSRLKTIKILEGVKSIGDRAFAECSKMESISLPKTVENIGEDIFLNNILLTNIQVSAENPNYVAEGNLLFNKSKTVLYSYTNAIGEIVLPEGIEEITEGIFEGSVIRKVIFPSTLKKIGDNVFLRCSHLEEIILPSSLLSFGKQTFEYCPKLKNINVFDTNGQKNFLSENGVLYNSDKTSLLCNPESGDIVVPDSVTTIGSYAFPNVRKSVTIPSSVTAFGENIFVNEVEEWTPANEDPLYIYGYKGSAIEEYCKNTNWGDCFLALDGTYTITYNLNGGDNNATNPKTFTRDTETIVLKKPVKKGYIFKYWYEDYSECEDGCCRGERKIKQIQKGSLGDIILNAKWKK